MNAAGVEAWIDRIHKNAYTKLDQETNEKIKKSREALKEKLKLLKAEDDVPIEIIEIIDKLRNATERPQPDAQEIRTLNLDLESKIEFWKPISEISVSETPQMPKALKTNGTRPIIQPKTDEKLIEGDVAIFNSGNAIKLKRVWIIHGRNEKLAQDIFSFLRAIGLDPIEWSEARAMTKVSSPYIGEILKAGFDYAQAFVVLLTGDDEAKLRDEFIRQNDPEFEHVLTPQARQNVIFEAGMAFGRDPDKIIFVRLGNIRPFSNISGIHILDLNDTPGARMEFANRLRSAGCDIPDLISRHDWLKIGNFEPFVAEQSKSISEIRLTYTKPELSKVGRTFLIKLSKTDDGLILRSGGIIQIGSELMRGDPRQRATLESAIEELENFDLIKTQGPSRDVFYITNKGYQVAETLEGLENSATDSAGAKALDAMDISILKTIADIDGAEAIPNDIVERSGLKGKLNIEELENHLDHIETTTHYIKNRWSKTTDSKGIYQTELTAKGREFVKQLSFSL